MIDGLSHITFIVSDLDKMEVILMRKKSMTAVIEPIHCQRSIFLISVVSGWR